MATKTPNIQAVGGPGAAPTGAAGSAPTGDGAHGDGPTLGATPLLGLFAIPLGVAGLGSTWSLAATTLSAPSWPTELLYGLSLAGWATLTLAYLVGALRGPGTFAGDRQHAIYGPFAAYIPVIAILLAAHYEQHARQVGRVAVAVSVAALVVVAAQLLAHWLLGNLPVATFHPGYLLPTVAGAFIASIGFSVCGWHRAAMGAFGVGVFFWLTIGTLIFNRLFTGDPLPDETKPSLSVLVSPPATAGLAWLIIKDDQIDLVGYGLLAIAFMFVLVQLLFFNEYRRLPFTTNFWAFTFPVAASAMLAMRWLSIEQFAYWQAWSWTLACVATLTVLAIAVATAIDVARRRRRPPARMG
jgi:tellurite resistance protein